ncbi:hypothetical protein [Agrobacterium burrii]
MSKAISLAKQEVSRHAQTQNLTHVIIGGRLNIRADDQTKPAIIFE